jgi:hypothetical protein
MGIVGFVVLKLSYQIFGWALSLLLPGVGWATIVVMLLFMHWAISLMVVSTKTVKVSTPKFSFASKR